jgi:hypothetical protein
MKRLYLTVEGQTEAGFVTDVLTPHLAGFQVFVHPPRFTGLHSRRGGRIPRGGLLNTFHHALTDLRTWQLEDQSPEARFSMMVDLYGLPNDFPGYVSGMSRPTGHEQARSLEKSLADVVGDWRFLPYLQVHEFEALVLVDPPRIASLYEVSDREIGEFRDSCAAFQTPEDINHGQHSHPKSRIEQVVPRYDENVAGPLLAHDIGLPTLRARCPHFGQWLTRLEQLDSDGP